MPKKVQAKLPITAKKEWRLIVRFRRRKRAYRRQYALFGNVGVRRPWIDEYQKVVTAPEVFSLINNPTASVVFIEELNDSFKKRIPVLIDLSGVNRLTYDAILALLSIVYQFQRYNINISGRFPEDYACATLLKETGFLEHFFRRNKKLSYDLNQKHITRKHGTMTLGEEASKIVSTCHKNIWGVEGRCKGVYRILLELMQNTHTHANPQDPGSENWWLAVNYDEERNTECFSFIDYGVGVFKSLADKPPDSVFYHVLDKMEVQLGTTGHDRMLRSILSGKMHQTATGQPFRGKGLPGIMQAYIRNQISRLFILTNDAYGAADKYDYHLLHRNFSGTFIYWELSDKCQYHYEDSNS